MSDQSEIGPAGEVLSIVGEDAVAEFITERIRARTLSKLIHDLNIDVIHGPPPRADRARDALDRIGFLVE